LSTNPKLATSRDDIHAVFEQGEDAVVALVKSLVSRIEALENQLSKNSSNSSKLTFIHVLEYLWKAAYCFMAPGTVEVETWVMERALNGWTSLGQGGDWTGLKRCLRFEPSSLVEILPIIGNSIKCKSFNVIISASFRILNAY
jgi:hypothetical protein